MLVTPHPAFVAVRDVRGLDCWAVNALGGCSHSALVGRGLVTL